MKAGQRVRVFTASGTFRGDEGTILERTKDGARVKLTTGDVLFFKRNELVSIGPVEHLAGAE